MNPITRRQLLLTTMLVPLAACAAVQSIPGLAADADLIAQAVKAVLPTIEALTGLAGGAKNEVAKLVDAIGSAAGQISGASGSTTAQLVTTIGSALAGIAGLVLGVPALPAIVQTAIGAALALLPVIEQAVGIAAPMTQRRFAAAMTPDQARAALRSVIAR